MYAEQGKGRKAFLDWVRENYNEEELRQRFHAQRLVTFLDDRFLNDRLLGRE
jgi:hypothetical protein